MATNHEIEQAEDGCDGYRIFRGKETEQPSYNGKALDPHAWYFEPDDYEGDVVLSEGFATRAEAIKAARNHAAEGH